MSEDRNQKQTNAPKRPSGARTAATRKTGAERKNFSRPENSGSAGEKGRGSKASGAEAYRWNGRKAGNDQKSFGEQKASGERKPSWDRKFSGDRKTAGDRPFGDRKPSGDHKSFGGRRHAGFADRKPGPAGGKPGRENGRREKPTVEGLESRRIALQVIRKVTEGGAYASLALDTALKGSGLSAADRRLATRLVYDTLDQLIYLDHALSQVMAREDTDIKLRNILRLGACQLLLEDRIPESAATNTCVELCAELGMDGLKGVCNGILRNLIRKKEDLTLPDPEKEPDKWHSVRFSVPEWLWIRLREDYGTEEAEKIVSYREKEESITIRPNLTRDGEEGLEKVLEKKIWGREKGRIPFAWHITGAMDIARDADFLAGAFSIQSESSMMASLAMAPKRGQQILDCCAAPGGKTCLMAELMGGTGRVQAWDVHEHRTELIEAQARRLGLDNIRPVTRDALRHREDLTASMDGVLLDAPCSGLGVLAEKPDIKLRVTEESVRELTELQARLLDAVCDYVKPGGTLVYSTCSLLRDENERQAEAFLQRHPEFEAVKLPDTIPEAFRNQERLGLQLLPHRDGVEGFYICRMRRRENP